MPQPALTPPNNKSIANQSPLHQRSGFGAKQWNYMDELLSKIVTLKSLSIEPKIEKMLTLNQRPIFEQLKELERLAELFIHCLEQPGFLTKLRPEQEAIIKTFCEGYDSFIPWPKALDELHEQKQVVQVARWKRFLDRVETALLSRRSPQTS
jgi:hypothetical protein